MSSRTIARSSSNMNSARARALGLPHAGRAEEDERADRPVDPAAVRARRSAFATASTASSCPTTRLVQPLLHVDQLRSRLEQAFYGDARPARDHGGDIVLVDLFLTMAQPPAAPRCELSLESRKLPYRISATLCGPDALGPIRLPGAVDAPLDLADALELLSFAQRAASLPRRAFASRACARPAR
jgi:hypothetical protein